MFSKIKSFISMLCLLENQLKNDDFTHFPTLRKHNPISCAAYALECSSLLEIFNARFQDIKSKQLELDIHSISFNVTPVSASLELQLQLIKLQSNDTLKAMYQNKPLLGFLSCLCIKERVYKLESSQFQKFISFRKHVPMRAIFF